MFKNVIVGVDGQEGGRDAIALAQILRGEDGELTLAYVYHGDSHVWRGSSPPYEAAEEQRTRELLEQARENASLEAQLRSHGSPSVGRGLHEGRADRRRPARDRLIQTRTPRLGADRR